MLYKSPMPKKNTPPAEVTAKGPVPLNLPDDLKALVSETARELGMSKQDIMRQSLRRGIPILVALMKAA